MFLSQITRLAVLKPYRGYGLGKLLVQAVHDYVKAKEPDEMEVKVGGDGKGSGREIKLHAQVD